MKFIVLAFLATKMSILDLAVGNFNGLIRFIDSVFGSLLHGWYINQQFLIFAGFVLTCYLTYGCFGTLWAEIVATAAPTLSVAGILWHGSSLLVFHWLAVIIDSFVSFLFFLLEQRLIHKLQMFYHPHLPLHIWAYLRSCASNQHFVVFAGWMEKVDGQVRCSIGSAMSMLR